jgi:hypothetical protein
MVRISSEVNMPTRLWPRGLAGQAVLCFAALSFPDGTWAGGQAPAPSGLKIVVLEGEGAINNIRERRAKEPVVRVLDDDNQPVAGAAVNFQLTELGPSATFPGGTSLTITTDQQGQAVGRGLRPNNIAGQFQIRVTASYRGRSARATITQTNVAPVAARRTSSSRKIAIILIAGGGAAAAATLGLTRGSKGASTPSSPAKPPATPTTILPGSGSFGKP